ncbi:aminodeoxychorismate lyase [Erwinia sp. 9145]|uniref:aminodeoxychorismate lyase n=1 Tax=Erwinia sp. 9145 TaxID=1500895 RepID=UPI000551613E|nr:aminodeoxychorismate lyase [Erwinia sp. 9145]
MAWINGKSQDWLTASDRAVQFGDGCFTTARVLNGAINALDAHLVRLQAGCQRLRIADVDWSTLQKEMREVAAPCSDGVIKVIISRGQGGRGYSPAGCQQPTRLLSLSPYPAHYHTLRQRGCRLALSSVRLARSPLLAGIKHLNRLEQVLIRAELEQSDADEALVLDTEGSLVECCAANLFWRRNNDVFTPDLSHSGVEGIQRQQVIRLLKAQGVTTHIVTAPPEILADADEVIITNALMPVLPVNQIETWRYSSRQLFDQLAATANNMDIS